MKIIAVFYLILVVLFSASPCNDEAEIHEFSNDKIAAGTHTLTNENGEHCALACLCICCGQNVIQTIPADFNADVQVVTVDNLSSNYYFVTQQRAQNIWQPPKFTS